MVIILKFGGLDHQDGEMYCPIGITTHHDKVHVADQSNHHVSVYRTSGEYCFSFGSNGYIPSMDLRLNFHAL